MVIFVSIQGQIYEKAMLQKSTDYLLLIRSIDWLNFSQNWAIKLLNYLGINIYTNA